MDDDTPARPSVRAIIFVAIPALLLTIGIPFANRLEPMILGMPFLLAYIIACILATPVFLYAAYRTEHARG